jgi:hypothetical protein
MTRMKFDRSQDYLRALATRLRSLAITEPALADQLHQIADDVDDYADAMVDPRYRPPAS